MSIYTDPQRYRYDAFISYSHLDKKAAAAFQRRMERYRIPKEIRMQRGKDTARLKIFRDETDLPAGSLTGAVNEALDASQKLIVICSSIPAAGGKDKYAWVAQEVQYFIDSGRQDDILPVLLDGNEEAMPENLKQLKKEQFVTDVSSLKQRTAFLKILSGVLGTDLDTLVHRDKKRRRIRSAALAASFCALFALCFFYFCPHTAYYADYTIRFGKPEGIGRLTAAQRAARSESFAITTAHSKHEIRLEHINSAGLVSMDASENHLEQIAAAVYDCLDDWQINTVTYLDETGKQLYTHSYAPDLTYLDIIKSKDDAQWLTLPVENGEDSLPVRTNISRYQLEFGTDGFLRQRMYAVDRLSAVGETGTGGERYQYDPQGRLVKMTYLDTTGNADINKYGIAGKNFFYDAAGRLSKIEYYGVDGGLINNNMKYAAVTYAYGGAGENLEKICYYNEKGALVTTAYGYAQEIRRYDSRGFLTSIAYFDDAEQPVRGPDRFHKIEIVPDSMGRDIESAYLDTDDSLILTTGHYAKRSKRYNEQGLVEDIRWYDEDGRLDLSSEGSCHVHYEYNGNGNLEEISHYGLDGRLIYSSNGYAVMKLTYNGAGLQETERYFGVNEEPILGKEGYHEKKYEYDSRYNIHEIHLIGTMGQPALCTDGYALRILEYDNAGNIRSDSYFDDYGQPAYRKGSYSKVEMEYDDRGHRTLTEWLDPDGTPAGHSSYSSQKVRYDDIGRKEKIWYYLLDELRFMQEYEYQGSSLSVRTDYLNGSEDGQVTVHRYNERGHEVETSDYNGNRLTNRSVSEFDAYGNMVRRTFHNGQDERTHYFVSEYNSYGMPTKTSYYDADGQLSREANTAEHVAIVESVYDGHNLRTERKCYDENKLPLRIVSGGKDSYARLETDHDRNGNCIRSMFYDEKGNAYQSVVQEYDAYNREVNRIYLDGGGAQLVRKEVVYDTFGNVISSALYDRKDALQADPASGVAKIICASDSYGYVVSGEFYGAGGQPVAPFGAYHKYEITRENGRSVEIRYYGTDGRLALNHDGYAVEKFTYDERGNEIGRAFFGVDGEPILLKWRFSRYEVQHDDNGKLSESRFFDTAGREVRQVDGHLSESFAYINSVPKRMLIFYGNDGTSLMGDVEQKLYIPLQEFVKPDDDSTDTSDVPPAGEKESDETLPEEEQPPVETEASDAPPAGEKGNDEALPAEEQPPREEEPEEKEGSLFSDREYISAVNDYVRAIEGFEGTGIMDVIETSTFNAAAVIAASQLGSDISEYKIYHFYAAFYGEELAALEASLHEKYGSDIYITYEIQSEEYRPADEITAANQVFRDLGVDNFELQQMVTLDIAYTVSGSNGQGLENEGFLSRQLVLMQVGGQWKIGSGEGFPSPSKDQLIKLYTGQ